MALPDVEACLLFPETFEHSLEHLEGADEPEEPAETYTVVSPSFDPTLDDLSLADVGEFAQMGADVDDLLLSLDQPRDAAF